MHCEGFIYDYGDLRRMLLHVGAGITDVSLAMVNHL